MDKQLKQYAIALQNIKGLGARSLQSILSSLNDFDDLLAGKLAIDTIDGLKPQARNKLVAFLRNPQSTPEWELAIRALHWLEQAECEVIFYEEPSYPERLKELYDAPAFIYVKGDLPRLNNRSIAIVGARNPTSEGLEFAHQLGKELSSAGLTVISGMALGIDAAAHKGAINGNAGSIAVWATGLDLVHPKTNRDLGVKIAENGCIVSEMPLGTPSIPGYFPRRNRIVSGMSLGVIVVEAALPSGSLITANLAAEQNREVFAVPGRVNSLVSKGCHQLIKDGAHLIESAQDVMAILGGFQSLPVECSDQPASLMTLQNREGLLETPLQKEIVSLLSKEPASIEMFCKLLSIDAEAVSSTLVDLELMGIVCLDGALYRLRVCH